MVTATRFGKRLKLPSTVQLKHALAPLVGGSNAEGRGRGKEHGSHRAPYPEADVTLLTIAAVISTTLALTALLAARRFSEA